MTKSWRPKEWVYGQPPIPFSGTGWYRFVFCESKNPLKTRALTEGEKDLFEQGADAMLKALREKGKYIDASRYPYGFILNQINSCHISD